MGNAEAPDQGNRPAGQIHAVLVTLFKQNRGRQMKTAMNKFLRSIPIGQKNAVAVSHADQPQGGVPFSAGCALISNSVSLFSMELLVNPGFHPEGGFQFLAAGSRLAD